MYELIYFIIGDSLEFNMFVIVAFFCFCLTLNFIVDLLRAVVRSSKS